MQDGDFSHKLIRAITLVLLMVEGGSLCRFCPRSDAPGVDDGNDFVDDYYGWNFAGVGNNDPIDDYGHGIQCAGIASVAALLTLTRAL